MAEAAGLEFSELAGCRIIAHYYAPEQRVPGMVHLFESVGV